MEKNVSGTYSDEIFKEQNKIVEEKIRALQIAKNDDLLLKYNLEAITKFIKNKLGNLTQTYIDSTLEQKRILLCSIYPSGMHWGENGYSNTQISKFYRSILGIQTDCIPFGSLNALPIEHLLKWLDQLMLRFTTNEQFGSLKNRLRY